MTLFDEIAWRDPISRKKQIPKVSLRDPAVRKYFGVMQRS